MMITDKKELCDFITEKKVQDMAWKDISIAVKERFGEDISAGNLYNIYTRYVRKVTNQSAFTEKVIQTYARTHNKVFTASQCNTSKYSVSKELNNNADYLKEVEDGIKAKVIQMINNHKSFEDISTELGYNDIPLGFNLIGSVYAEVQQMGKSGGADE